MSDLAEILVSLYASEINASIFWLWDGGIDVKLGDPLNGYDAEGKVSTFAEAATWLRDQAWVADCLQLTIVSSTIRSTVLIQILSPEPGMGQVLERLKRILTIVAVVALLAGCRTAAWPQYQAAVTNLASEECRALQAVVEERERYGIVAPSRDLDEEKLRSCSLPHSSGGGPPFQTTPYSGTAGPALDKTPLSHSAEVIIEKRGDTYMVPVRLNQTITLPFLLDTGATDLVIPADVALTLMGAGALKIGDFIGKSRYSMANGSEQVSDRVIIREVQVGGHTVRNVTAIVSPPAGDALLGRSFLSKFGSVTLDYNRLVLVLSR